MSSLMRTRAVIAAFFIAVGIGFLCLPDTWIEVWFGVDPDGGNGWLEAVLAAAPLALGLGLGLEVFLRYRRKNREAPVGGSEAPRARS
jgi:hypothetical protein